MVLQIHIKTLSSENISELDNLKIDNSTKREIKTALNNGKTVIVPEKDICYYQWKGTGYIVLNTDTGEAAYMISGTLCGGSSLEDIGLFAVTILVTVAVVFTLCLNAINKNDGENVVKLPHLSPSFNLFVFF